jgi:NADH dehydrogenase FAD-containing subunit
MRLEQPAPATGKKIVVIVGGGFAGLNAAKRLANAPAVHVVLVDQRNHHLFQPLLYQVATAGLTRRISRFQSAHSSRRRRTSRLTSGASRGSI